MAGLFDWSTVASENTSIDGINTATGMPVANTDNVFRSMAALIRQSFATALENFLSGAAGLPVANGGTGATAAAGARANLGAAASGANSDITALNGATGAISTTGTIGYVTGAGGTVTQTTSKSTGVTINKICGSITTHNASLAAGSRVAFTVTNSTVAATDTVILHVKSGPAAPGSYAVYPCGIANGSFDVAIHNFQGTPLSEAIVMNFSVIKGVAA